MSALYLFWDIDGTLLTTARAGWFAWEDAAREVLGVELDPDELETSGLTDFEIARLIGALHSHDGEAAGQLLRAYADALPGVLGRRRGQVLPNVRENLDALSGRDDVVNLLLTGNVEPGARAKLEHYGLAGYFPRGGAFCVEGSDRPSIARAARALAAEHGGEEPPGERMVVIGDTPHDVACGKAIGARTVAVASGPGHTAAELAASEPWLLLEGLPAPAQFLRRIGLGDARPLREA